MVMSRTMDHDIFRNTSSQWEYQNSTSKRNEDIMHSANARLLIAIDENYNFPSDFRKYIPISAASTGATVLERNLDITFAQQDKVANRNFDKKCSTERENAPLHEGHRDSVKTQTVEENAKILDINSISMDDIVWANCYLIVAPANYKMAYPKVCRFTEILKEPYAQKEIRNKVVTAMTVSKREDTEFTELLKDIYNRFISLGTIIAPTGISHNNNSSASSNPYGYRQIIGESVDERLVDDQIRHLATIAGKLNAKSPEVGNAFFNILW